MEEQDYYSEEESSQYPTSKNKKRENCKRFSDEQVKLLESVFSRGAKLEPRKKLQLARDIGLQPRQVSIWFQNKRARWKTKQLEQEYRVLKDKFDDLYEQFESLKKEKETLLDQFNTLRRLLENGYEDDNISKNASEDVKIRDYRDEVFEMKDNNEEMLYEDEEQKVASKYFRQEDKPQVVNFSGQEGSLLASQEQQHNLVSGCHFDELCCPSSWWEL